MSKITLTNKKEYEDAVLEAEGYFKNEPEFNSKKGERFKSLLDAIQEYEQEVLSPVKKPT